MEHMTQAQVAHLAHLSRLHLTEEEIAHYTTELAAVLAYAEQLPNLPPLTYDVPNLELADDIAQPSTDPKILLSNARELEDGQIKVPAILDRGEGA